MKIKRVLIIIPVVTLFSVTSLMCQHVGINTQTPQATLDVNGDVIFRIGNLIVTDSIIVALDVNSTQFSCYRISGADSAFVLAGISPGIDGRMITLINKCIFPMQLNDEDTTAAAENRIATGNHEDIALDSMGTVSLQYDGLSQRWLVHSRNQTGSAGIWNMTGDDIYFENEVAIGAEQPEGKLHITGSEDVSQFIIDASGTQTNANPLIKLRNGSGDDLLWIYSDDDTNCFIGFNAGVLNGATTGNGIGGTQNTFIGSSAATSNTIGYANTVQGYAALNANTTGSENTAIGNLALYSSLSGTENTGLGSKALFSNTVGSANTASGVHALYSNTMGSNNSAHGYQSLNSNMTGNSNTANGFNALFQNSTGSWNTACGAYSLLYNTTASNNTAIGAFSLLGNYGGTNNTAVGANALFSNNYGNDNTATGKSALESNLGGNDNTAFGVEALTSNTYGSGNTATGYQALWANTTGLENLANGLVALKFNTKASRNIAIGNFALFYQSYNPGTVWTSDNVAVGHSALLSNQPTATNNGFQNTAIGNSTLYSNTTGYRNTAVGFSALSSNVTGAYNSAFGTNALYANTTGVWNSAFGNAALYNTIAGSNNTAFGYAALFNNTGGNTNTAIGYNAGTGVGAPNVSNTISIGNDGYFNGASNQAFIGNTTMAWNGGNVTWSTFSDARVKNNVQEDVKGLDFITRLKPVTYYRSINAMAEITGNAPTQDYPEKYDIEKIKFTGFLAQDVEQAARDAEYDFSGITIPKNNNELYTLSYEQFVVPLVKAVQEQQAIIENQQKQIDLLVKRLEALEIK